MQHKDLNSAPTPDEKKTDLTKSTSKQIFDLMHSEDDWKDLYTKTYGRPVFREDYQAQFIAARLYEEASQHLLTEKYLRLEEHIKKFSTKPWVLFYKAVIAKEKNVRDARNIYHFAIEALMWRDTRAGTFIIEEFKTRFNLGIPISIEHLTQTLGLLLNFKSSGMANKELSLINCLLFKKVGDIDDKAEFKNEALIFFFHAMHADSKDIKGFSIFFIEVFNLLDIISDSTAQLLKDDEKLSTCTNVLDAIMYIYNTYKPFYFEPVFDWIKTLANSGNVAAHYHYLQYMKSNTEETPCNNPEEEELYPLLKATPS